VPPGSDGTRDSILGLGNQADAAELFGSYPSAVVLSLT
jgi:hypothetical protein